MGCVGTEKFWAGAGVVAKSRHLNKARRHLAPEELHHISGFSAVHSRSVVPQPFPSCHCGKGLILGPGGIAHDVAEGLPFFVAEDSDHAPPVRSQAFKAPMGRSRQMIRSIPLGHYFSAIGQPVQERGAEQRAQRFIFRQVDILPLAGSVPVFQGRQSGQGGIKGGDYVSVRNPEAEENPLRKR
jgi:hypothetical protein